MSTTTVDARPGDETRPATTAAGAHAAGTAISRKAVAAAVAGNALEFYDFVIYAYFAVYIGRTFFPVGGEFGSLMLSLATFGVGFFTRPLGGVLIGAFADKAGRKPAMLLTVALITFGTLGMAATPSYASIGIAAPVIVVFCRLLQGLALGGEVGPATALLIEAAPPGRRGLYASWQIASQGIAVAVGGVFGVTLSLMLPPDQLASWGWRVPFLFSLVLIPIAFYIRRSLPETHEGSRDRTGAQIVGSVFGKHRRILVLGILISASTAVASQVGNYMVTYAVQVLKLPPALAQGSVLTGGVMTFLFALLGGWLCDRHGRKVINTLPRIALVVLIVPMFLWLSGAPSAVTLLGVSAVLAALTAVFGAAGLVTIPELMPIAIRSTGLSLVYAISTSLFGGTTQFVVTWLLAVTHNPLAPAYYVMVMSALSVWAMWMLPESRDVDVTR
ncbi:Major Facilitator Superfamily protein [Variovorax sp. OK605]|uniref:MFS transporter n=1 Tax=unclassified Variovorax TaxID=663243 RepID=UPI0008CBAEF6|nr:MULTISPECIES: MFS transporter [unclassified Variovorax]SEK16490.1 Major Facilitator Superfamily protein [Variovorax sp. OK202]SFE49352.1 Major Facilitator Superfamily protein [Variovorax sp. OK212]SFQ68523.1 Major Facilitator Superfamily protein [Variovorax sp. OK605]